MSQIYLDRENAQLHISQIQTQAEALENAALAITSAMLGLSEVWKGSAADRAQMTYETEYKGLLTETIPRTVEEFRQFLGGCVQAIYETDQQLSR